MEIQIKQLIAAVKQIAEEKNLPEDVVHEAVEQALAAAYRKDFGEREQNVVVQLNSNTGDMTAITSYDVVEDDAVENDAQQLTVEQAQKFKKGAKLGDVVTEEAHPTTFGRVAAQTAKQVILQRLREAEREIVLTEYEDKIGTVIVGTVQRVEPRVVRVDLGKATGILPASEQIQGEYYGVGSRIKVFLKDVERGNRGPQLVLSRANEEFIEYLFRQEVPEMESGAVEIKGIARQAGMRTKIAVASTAPGVDPVGTFVGGHGTRVQAVMNEIGDQEKIDIVTFAEDSETYIKNALSPTEVIRVELNEKAKHARVIVDQSQLSIAIGKAGQNVRLASKLTGYELDIESGTPKTETPVEEVAPAPDPVVEETAPVEEVVVAPVVVEKPAEAKKSTKPKRRDDIEAGLLGAIEEQGE
ncbi:MAG TPA: transcription termination factor NusA [Candidatus Saccharibacteria bacterium]|jgi:N utilization substance protein A|nr:transcription termination/antitermination protein NusA [Patescibacteria group bacterium]HMS30805.1 transcription termination factor NusA [Candidatus Saccharibacteria bacterium]